MTRLHNIIFRPVETEKSVSAGNGVYTFEVQKNACKTEIADAIEKYYGVKVAKVRTLKNHEKTRSAGRRQVVKRAEFKKAVVVTKDAAIIDVNSIKVAA